MKEGSEERDNAVGRDRGRVRERGRGERGKAKG